MYITYSDDEVTKNMSVQVAKTIQDIANRYGVILLYHSIMTREPPALATTLHNTTAKQLQTNLQNMSDYFEFVCLEEFSQASSKAGLVCVTFDDGYHSVLENALPVMESLNCPFTVFLNPITFESRWNWRDKVRYLIHHQCVDDFLATHEIAYTEGRFYRFTKNPINDSSVLDLALDKFIAEQIIDIYAHYPYLTAMSLIKHPLVSYGNHTQNHYVLASLSDQQQYFEISKAHENISELCGSVVSCCFSAPFGGTHDINTQTLKLTDDLSYKSILMSRQQLQPKKSMQINVQILERFMPRSHDILSELLRLDYH